MRLLLLCVLFLPACSVMRSLESAGQSARLLIDEGTSLVKEARAEITAAKVAADTDKDGKTSGSEWLAYLLGGGSSTGVLALLVRNMMSDKRKSKNEAETREAKQEIAVTRAEVDSMKEMIRAVVSKTAA